MEDFAVSSALIIVEQNQEFVGLLNIFRKMSQVEIKEVAKCRYTSWVNFR